MAGYQRTNNNIKRCNTSLLLTRLFFVIVFLQILVHTSFSQPDWQLSKSKNGIKVYTRKEENSKFKSIKVEAVFKGTVEKFVKIIRNVSGTKNWVYGIKNAYLLKESNTRELLYYTETNLPSPVSNRDIAIRMKLDFAALEKSLEVTETGIPDAVAEKKGIVRVPYFNARWVVKAATQNQIAINYILKMDPGGSIPAAVVNLFTTKGPYDTFEKLGKLLAL